MSLPTPSLDEAILLLLVGRGPQGSADLAAGLGRGDRTVRRRLRQLIRGGYVFSPERGRYRITAAGVAAMAPIEEQSAPGTFADLLDRWQRSP